MRPLLGIVLLNFDQTNKLNKQSINQSFHYSVTVKESKKDLTIFNNTLEFC